MKRLISLLAPILLLAACSNEAVPPQIDTPLSETSLYLMDTGWTTDTEETIQLSDLRGQPVALAMVYTSCGHACPMIVSDAKKIADGLADSEDVQFVLVSLDPDRDSVQRLHEFRQAHGLGEDWTILRSDDVDVRTLAALLDVRYRFEADGNIAHSNRITLLNSGGEIIGRQEGLGADPAPAISILQEATNAAL